MMFPENQILAVVFEPTKNLMMILQHFVGLRFFLENSFHFDEFQQKCQNFDLVSTKLERIEIYFFDGYFEGEFLFEFCFFESLNFFVKVLKDET